MWHLEDVIHVGRGAARGFVGPPGVRTPYRRTPRIASSRGPSAARASPGRRCRSRPQPDRGGFHLATANMDWGMPLFVQALGLAAPWTCAGCGRPDNRWCGQCARTLDLAPRVHVPSPRPAGLPALYVSARYEGPLRAAMVAWKDRGRRDMTAPLAAALSRLLASLDQPDRPPYAVIPIPSTPAAVRRRGEDVLARVVRAAVAVDGVWAVVPALRHRRIPRDQSELDAQERRRNLAGALTCARPMGGPVVLVDDIVTTGATLAEGARALRDAGAQVVAAVAIAATPRRAR